MPAPTESALLYKHADVSTALTVKSGHGLYLALESGQQILDATSGAGVTAIGHGNARVKAAIAAQLDEIAYVHPGFYKTTVAERLADFLVESTEGKMARAVLVGSGSEAVEAAMKLARQYFLELSPPQPTRSHFIAREGSWHGCTLGALAVGDFKVRKQLFEPLLPTNVTRVSACNAYRGLLAGESTAAYVARLAAELEAEFRRLGPETVCGFIAEPLVGTALGCVTAVPGYFEAVKAVCDRHGALLIFDEVICGMGRTGTMHAWEQEGVVPDIQAVGKGLASGYGVISALLVNDRVVSALKKGSGYFAHGQTYQTHALSCAAALEVQRIIREEKLLGNVRRMGKHMEALLKERLGGHPNVGDIRGRGLFWGIEFVADKATKEPLDPELQVAKRLHSRGLKKGYDISIFPATGAADGWRGDQIWLAPPYIVQKRDVEEIVSRLGRVVEDVFKELATSC
ncbi:alanine-glyoxylate aminotransferase AGT2 [Sphaerosporella brunnea]|uniref:Alanine-glyoxylate aminotransferase AGT2 n=1 Tax=Sphaerosporella brunnea TaxID=1250544 RepID=A0A5J5ENK7_9PEZI|nr:alanine-glyoxylate aminotransferase AGT2 [Sphaerosporella brunnea]